MNADTLASARAAIERDRETERGMSVAPWFADPKRSRESWWFVRPGSPNAFPNVNVDVHSAPGGHGADAVGIARARNRWPLYLALAEAAHRMTVAFHAQDVVTMTEAEGEIMDAVYALTEQEPTP